MPAFLVDEEDVLGLGQELDLADLVLLHPRVLGLERDALPVLVEAHAHLGLPHVGVDGDELGERVGVGLPRLPRGGRGRRPVVVVEEHDAVRVEEVDEGLVVLGVFAPGRQWLARKVEVHALLAIGHIRRCRRAVVDHDRLPAHRLEQPHLWIAEDGVH